MTDDSSFPRDTADRLAALPGVRAVALPGVRAVALGGSRAQGTHRPVRTER
ncbi:hypothetical protein [Streptomyces kebangsaanensis]|uniref:hypothetical protein n=1 Tax=Streptomyces kebangsaanensis TaxID=864058 RepID=UPI000ADDC7AF|nr:hypothetical protein [Streptomyces kebangsaanensis]